MIRRLLLAALVPLAFAAAPATQPLAPADSALIEAYLDASGNTASIRSQTGMMESMVAANPAAADILAAFSPEAVLDSVRAAFARDFRRGALEEAVALLRDPEMQDLVDFQQQFSGGFAEAQALFADLMANPDAYDLGDADLAAEYVAAIGMTERMGDMMAESMGQMMSAFPGVAAEAAAQGLTVRGYAARMVRTELLPMMDSTMTLAARYSLRDVRPETTRRLIGFYRSEPGRYVMDTAWEGSLAGVRPMFDAMTEAFDTLLHDVPPPPAPCKKGTPGCAAGDASTPPPPPPASGEDRLWRGPPQR